MDNSTVHIDKWKMHETFMNNCACLQMKKLKLREIIMRKLYMTQAKARTFIFPSTGHDVEFRYPLQLKEISI